MDDVNWRVWQLQVKDVAKEPLKPGDDLEERIAFRLLFGVHQVHENGRVSFQYLPTESSNTDLTEQDGRIAIANLLLSDKPPRWLLQALAALFAPELASHPHQRRVVFKQVSKGHARPMIDYLIALRVHVLREEGGHSYEEAIGSVAKTYGRDERHIKKIYARHKSKLVVSSDRRSDDMASDR